MTRLHEMQQGKVDQVLRQLSSAGFDAEMAEALLKRPEMTRQWVNYLKLRVNPGLPELFRSPKDLYADFLDRANQRGWNISEGQLRSLGYDLPRNFKSRLSSVLTLDIWLGDLRTTFEELWLWTESVLGEANLRRSSEIESGDDKLRLRDAERYGDQPSVRWAVLDLTDVSERMLKGRLNGTSLPGLEVLSTAALHPKWPLGMDGDVVRGVQMPGLQLAPFGDEAYVPQFGTVSGNRLLLGRGRDKLAMRDPSFNHYVTPVCLHL